MDKEGRCCSESRIGKMGTKVCRLRLVHAPDRIMLAVWRKDHSVRRVVGTPGDCRYHVVR